jgi:hypothetical protein
MPRIFISRLIYFQNSGEGGEPSSQDDVIDMVIYGKKSRGRYLITHAPAGIGDFESARLDRVHLRGEQPPGGY